MTSPALLAILDTLLPGDDAMPRLPAFSAVGIDPVLLAASAAPILAAIDAPAFLQAAPAGRVAQMQAVERSTPEAFRNFLNQALAVYYQAPQVQAALGWRSEPPQPAGHRLAGDDATVLSLLEKVRRRGRLWRD